MQFEIEGDHRDESAKGTWSFLAARAAIFMKQRIGILVGQILEFDENRLIV
jgi:hypothetical protein